MKQNFFDNIKAFETISEELGEQGRLIQTLQPVSEYLEKIQHMHDAASVCFSGAYQSENSVIQKFHNLFEPYENYYSNIDTTVTLAGNRFQELVQPLYYLTENNGMYDTLNTFSSGISNIERQIDYSWLHTLNQWRTEVFHLLSIDTSSLASGLNQFAKLLKLEQETSRLALDVNNFTEITSISAQIASIEESFSNIAEP